MLGRGLDDGLLFGGLAAAIVAATIATFSTLPTSSGGAPAATPDREPPAVTVAWIAPTAPAAPVGNPLLPDAVPVAPAAVPVPIVVPADEVALVELLPPADPAEPAAPAARAKRCEVDPDPAIIRREDGTVEVDRSVVRRYTLHWGRLEELGWSRVHAGADGRRDGIELGGIKCGSDLWDAGLRSGDVIQTVNGRTVQSSAQALLAYAMLRDERAFEVTITRRGRPRTLRYLLAG